MGHMLPYPKILGLRGLLNCNAFEIIFVFIQNFYELANYLF